LKAAVFKGIKNFEVEDHPSPEAGSEDIVVKVHACGICGSDLHSYTHGAFVEPGQVMGHEFVGEIVHAGESVSGVSVGDRVTASPVVPCMQCARCKEGRYNLCGEAWTTAIAYGRPGAFAEYVKVPAAVVGENVFLLDASIGDEAGAFVEPLAVAVHAVKLVEPVQGATALVLGLGTIGQVVVRTLRARGAGRTIATDISQVRLDAAAAAGAEVLDGRDGLQTALADALGDDGEVDVVFECTGVPALAEAAIEQVKPGGTIVTIALYDDPVAFDTSALVQKEIRLQGSIAYSSEDFRDAVGLLSDGSVDVTPLVTHRVPLDDIDAAFSVQLEKESSIKVLVRP
jgi:2-desacetyl-2-hydroxyethyl bacteriochlorophyllide A dehydrogenase